MTNIKEKLRALNWASISHCRFIYYRKLDIDLYDNMKYLHIIIDPEAKTYTVAYSKKPYSKMRPVRSIPFEISKLINEIILSLEVQNND